MATLFSDYDISAKRLAELLTLPPADYPSRLLEWHSQDQRSVMRRSYYRPTRLAIRAFHAGERTLATLADECEERLLDADVETSTTQQDWIRNNVRAITQYLAAHGARRLDVQPDRKFEQTISGVRVQVAPDLFVRSGDMTTSLWLDCAMEFHESRLAALCHVTLWAARSMGVDIDQVEVIHSANGRIVARQRVPHGFADTVRTATEVIHRVTSTLRTAPALRR